jgi:hypothetical protein
MAKKKTKKQPAQAADAVRSAVDQAFQAGQSQFSRERASELVDDLSQVAGRLREALDDLRPIGIEDLKQISDKLDSLEVRVATLEKPAPPRRAPAKRTTASRASTAAKKPAAKRTTSTAAKRTPAREPAGS